VQDLMAVVGVETLLVEVDFQVVGVRLLETVQFQLVLLQHYQQLL
jgi:hypothetical protein